MAHHGAKCNENLDFADRRPLTTERGMAGHNASSAGTFFYSSVFHE
jgi:hypothetical protein